MTLVGRPSTDRARALAVRLASTPIVPGFDLGRTAAWAASLTGFGAVGLALVTRDTAAAGDAIAYWLAGSRALAGEDLYGVDPGAVGAYLYPPWFAQVVAPLTVLPAPAFVWLWRAGALLALRYVTGSWLRTGLAMLMPPVIVELNSANVHLPLAAACVMLMRGRAAMIGPALAVKAATVTLLPLAWLKDRRGLIVGLAVVALASAVSLLLAPAAWAQYLSFLGATHLPATPNLSGFMPIPLRVVLAVALAVASLRWIRLAPVALIAGLPIIWYGGLSILVATATPLGPTGRRGGRNGSHAMTGSRSGTVASAHMGRLEVIT